MVLVLVLDIGVNIMTLPFKTEKEKSAWNDFEKQADKKRKGDWMVTITSTVTKKETYLIENETKEDAEYIATDQNCSPRFKCTFWNSTESDPEEEEVVSKEVSFELDENKKGYWKEV